MAMNSDIFWGLVITVLGFTMLLKALFKIDIQIVSLGLGILLIYWGVNILFPNFFSSKTIIVKKNIAIIAKKDKF
jgi:hypothetical protein